jgi:RNA polymerase sigma-70 factor (ECF subfamily)
VAGSREADGAEDDATLVAAVARGSQRALEVLYDRHAVSLFGLALRMTGDRGTAEEIVQETFLSLWNRADSFDPRLGSVAGWLQAVARRRAIDRLRASARRPPLSAGLEGGRAGILAGGLADPTAAIAAPGGVDDPATTVERRAVGELVLDALAQLDDAERRVILLAYQAGLSQSEIADRLGWPLGTVKTRTRRALAHLRQVLAPLLHEESTTELERDRATRPIPPAARPADGSPEEIRR